ncbi:TPM domain-containing protein [Sphingomonas sp. MMS24-J13]|uniref:TPM domain-containing protein n=1 Tax=Sphingomonas sp. MMS24-J13 TaxID=3238686 RepID=UPI0038508270
MGIDAHDRYPGFGRDALKRAIRALSWALALFVTVPASAQSFPTFTNFVVDQANILPSGDEARLDHALANLQKRTRHQLAVVTVSSLQGLPINDYSLRLFRTSGVGRKHYDDGVVILVAPKDHKVRIEVGYGLEATLTDPRCAAIIRDLMLPAFTKGNFAGGINAGANAIIARLNAAAPLETAGQ